MQLIKSTLLTVPHGFSMREGGVSKGAYASLNTAYSVGDEKTAVDENLRRLREAAKSTELLTISQVHGTEIVDDTGGLTVREADGIWSQRNGIAVGVRTADCLPILIEDPVGRRVAAVHAGWRGVIGGIAPKAIELFEALGGRPSDFIVAIGPAIGPCCFEVDGDLAERFRAAFGPQVLISGYAKPHLDLISAMRASLEKAGVRPGNLDVVSPCTHCDARFFSHRRDRGVTGRHLSFITCRFDTDPKTGL